MAKDNYDRKTGELFPEFVLPYGPKLDVGVDCSVVDSRATDEPNQVHLTQQNFRDECDINTIMAKYESGHHVDHVNKFNGDYGDFANVADYQSAINIVKDADEAFSALDARTRARFDNDPVKFLEFVHNSDRETLIAAGLANPLPVDSSSPKDPIPPQQEPAPAGGNV